MKTKKYLAPLLVLILAAVAFSTVPRADEGFWPYNSIPRAAIKAKYGFTVTDAWLNHLQLATVRFTGGTGSIVSPNGLVLTNHHIALRSLQQLSTPEKDLVKNGFVAPTYANELKVPQMTLSVLQSIEDVTARVNAVVTPGMTPQDATAARQKAIQGIQGEAQTGVNRQVVALYAGAVYNLYTYKVYTDVRLVFGAEYQTGFFGGDPDNFTYPRYALDLGMFRLYENDKPAVTPNYLKWSLNGSKENELVFTTGHPGSTQRLNTLAHFEYRRDLALPFAIGNNEMRESAVKKWAALSPENARQTVGELFRIQNSLKSQRGQLKGLQDPAVMARKEASEKRLRAELAKNPAKQQELGDAWDIIGKALIAGRQLDADRNFIVNAAGLNSTLFTMARNMVRAAYNPQPAGGRGEGGRGGRGGGAPGAPGGPAAPGAGGRGGAQQPTVNIPREKINLTESLAFMQKYLGPTHAIVKRILGDKTPEARATELIDKCRLLDTEIRTLLQAGGRATIDASTDPMIVLARSLEADAQAVTKRYDAEFTAVLAAAYTKIGQAVFAVDGAKAYPDATGTLRLSYGAVKSYMEDGKKILPYTDFAGLYARSADHNGQPPYNLAPRWVENKAAVNLKTPFDFVSTNDIVGGNSGSAVVNRKGELVGLIFDGNIQSLPGYFVYEEPINRAVSVDSRAIVEALRSIYKAGTLADEITGKKPVAAK
ncbi:MAG: S46 family peptidase [Acidobacteria bacterium]|nr:S46 family peptidase [Acidobacteriota bacterium]